MHKKETGMQKSVMVSLAALGLLLVIAVVYKVSANFKVYNPAKLKHYKESLLRREADASYGGASQVMIPQQFLSMDSVNRSGGTVDLTSTLASDRTTVLYFHSDACHYAKNMQNLVVRLANSRPDLKICKVDIDREGATGADFGSPVAQQFNVTSVPRFRIYNQYKELVASGSAAKDMVKNWLVEKGIAGADSSTNVTAEWNFAAPSESLTDPRGFEYQR